MECRREIGYTRENGLAGHLVLMAMMKFRLNGFMDSIKSALESEGFAFRSGTAMQTWLGPDWTDWASFAASWSDLGEDRHMADGGHYRRRRYAVFDVTGKDIHRAPHQPHFQAKTYNRLNGGFDRWFDPVAPEIARHPIIQALIRQLAEIFAALIPADAFRGRWHVELHQFRIEASAEAIGRPTPEGVHRDGVDGAFVMLINRENVLSGVTQIFDRNEAPLGHFTLSDAGDAVFLDDARVFHGVTPIAPLDPQKKAIRDVLVITFTAT
jgi:hypothetical protein